MKVIKVFEYSSLVVNANFTQKHFEQLVLYNERHGNKYFNVGNKRIYFKNYVGVLQVGNLVIEILPKTDNSDTEEIKNKWHNALIYMLHICGYINIDTVTRANLQLQSTTLIELFYKLFLDEVKDIVHQGLTRAYRYQINNRPHLKGRLIFNKHIAENYLHKEMFYTSAQVYDHNNTYNQILCKALRVLKNNNKGNRYYNDICNLLYNFEGIKNIEVNDKTFETLKYSRNNITYESAITLARMILQNYSPDLKSGVNNVINILFDMNILFEKVVYRLLKKYESEYSQIKLKLYAQSSKRFWNNRSIRPDILGEYISIDDKSKQTFILDTKWKKPKNNNPNDDDLKQMYVYNIHFGSNKSVLIYPKCKNSEIMQQPYNSSIAVCPEYHNHSCSTFFIDLFDENGAINKNAGKELFEFIFEKDMSPVI
jgi:5-methylcytosine-specific restriction enzyme subunit McrC